MDTDALARPTPNPQPKTAEMKSNQPAFPQIVDGCTAGLTARDYIAIEAMKALIPTVDKGPQSKDTLEDAIERVCRRSYAYADVMIAESNKAHE